MKKLHTYLRSILLLFVSLFVGTSSYASHILAMDLYYTWVSGNTYKITAILYGDCSPASRATGAFGDLPISSPQICIFRGTTNVATISLTLQLQGIDSGVDITPVCPSEVGLTQCENPASTIPGIKQFIYSANYTLSSPVSGVWQFAYFGNNGPTAAQAGRSASITNIVNPMGTSLMELVDTLDNTVYPNNSSAQFSVIPTPFFCLNLPDSYNPGAIAPSGDSLSVVNLITAMDASAGGFGGPCQYGSPVTYTGTAWNPPFTAISATTPLNVVAGSYTYDVTTGQLNFTPNQIQRSTVVYNVREFRGGNFVGSSQREMNFLVQSCVSTPPSGGISSASDGVIVDSAQLTTCANSGPFSFTFDPREPGSINNITVTSSGVPSGATLNVTNNGTPTPHVVFSWTSNGVAPGTYIFYLTYTDNNCPLQGTNTTGISVTILPVSVVKYTVLAPITCAPKEAINITPSGTGSPWTVNVTGTTTQTFTGVTGSFIDSLPPGTDTISIVSATTNRCDSSAYIVIPSPGITGDSAVCAGAAITLSDAITGGTWSSSNASLATVGTASGIVTGVSGGVVTITYSFSGGCFKTATVTVKPLPSAIAGVMHVCAGSTTILSDAIAGGTWSSASPAIATITSASGIVTGVTAGSSIITYTTSGGCSITTTITVNQIPHGITGDSTVCTGATITLSDSSTGGIWASSNTAAATIGSGTGVVSGISIGATTITYTLTGNCFTTKTVTVYPTPSAITGPSKVCTGLTIMLSDTPTGGTWSSGNTAKATVTSGTGVLTGVTGGTAVITYTNRGTCIATTSITVNMTPTVIAGSPNICTNGTTLLVAAPGGGAWSINSTSVATITPSSTDDSATISGLGVTAGTTIVTYTLLGCTTTNTVNTVHVLPPITGPNQVCTGQSITMSDAIIGGTWASTNTAIATADVHAGVIVGVSPGVPTISYTIGGSCISTTTITVHQSPDHGAITGLSNLCVGLSIALSDTISGGAWSMTNDSATVIQDTVTGVFAGKDTVRYIVTNAFCRDTANMPVTIYPVPFAGAITGLSTLCTDTMIVLSDTISGGVWTSVFTSIATVSSSASGGVTGGSAGTDTIEYTVSNPGCSSIARHTIAVYNAPVPGVITGLTKVCAGSVFTLSDTTGGVWSSSNTSVATINNITDSVYALNAGAAIIHYTIGPNLGRCYGIAALTVTITPQNTLTINSIVSQITCYGDNNGSISVTVDGATSHLQYLWSNNDTIPMITGLAPGIETLHVTEPATLCYASDTFQISQPDSLHVSDTVTQDKCKQGNGTVTTIVTGGTQPYSYLWSDNSTGSDLENLHAGTYTVTVTDMNNCTQTIIAEVTNNDCIINIHDVITPNGDGINDTWIIEGIDNYPENTVQLFDKWGDMVYQKTNYNNDFGGKGKNGDLPDGTYYYVVKLNSENLLGTQNTWTGSMLIKR